MKQMTQKKRKAFRAAVRRWMADHLENFRCLEGYEDEFENFKSWWLRTH